MVGIDKDFRNGRSVIYSLNVLLVLTLKYR